MPEQSKKAEGGTTWPLPELRLPPFLPLGIWFSDFAAGLNDSTRPPRSPARRPQTTGRRGLHRHVSKFRTAKKCMCNCFLFGGEPYYNIQWNHYYPTLKKKDILPPLRPGRNWRRRCSVKQAGHKSQRLYESSHGRSLEESDPQGQKTGGRQVRADEDGSACPMETEFQFGKSWTRWW